MARFIDIVLRVEAETSGAAQFQQAISKITGEAKSADPALAILSARADAQRLVFTQASAAAAQAAAKYGVLATEARAAREALTVPPAAADVARVQVAEGEAQAAQSQSRALALVAQQQRAAAQAASELVAAQRLLAQSAAAADPALVALNAAAAAQRIVFEQADAAAKQAVATYRVLAVSAASAKAGLPASATTSDIALIRTLEDSAAAAQLQARALSAAAQAEKVALTDAVALATGQERLATATAEAAVSLDQLVAKATTQQAAFVQANATARDASLRYQELALAAKEARAALSIPPAPADVQRVQVLEAEARAAQLDAQNLAALARQEQVTAQAAQALAAEQRQQVTAFEQVQAASATAAQSLASAFNPNIARTPAEFAANLTQAAEALGNFASQGSTVTGLSLQQAAAVKQVSVNLLEQVAAGKISANVLRENAVALQQINIAGSSGAGLNQFATGLSALADKAGIAKTGVNNLQLAGTAMTASFGVSQAAAGNLQAAIFGLGFTLLFASQAVTTALPQLLGLIAVFSTIAIVSKHASDALDFFGIKSKEAASATEASKKITDEYTKKLDELAGTQVLAATGFDSIKKRAEALNVSPFKVLTDDFDRAQAKVASLDAQFENSRQALERYGASTGHTKSEVDAVIASIEQGHGPIVALGGALSGANDALIATANDLRQASNALGDATGEANKLREAFLAFSAIRIDFLGKQIQDLTSEHELNRKLDLELEVKIHGIEEVKSQINRAFQDLADAERDRLKDQEDAIRNSLQNQLGVIRDNLTIREDAIKEAAQKELDVNKDRIQKLATQEQELKKQLQDITSQRSSLLAESLKAQAELAELERQRRQQGGGTGIDAEIGLRQARLQGINNARSALDKEENTIKGQISSIEKATKAEQDRTKVIEKQRDVALRAAKDEADAQIKAANDASSAEIREAQRASKEILRALDDQKNAQIAVQDAAEEKLRKDKAEADFIRNTILPLERERLSLILLQSAAQASNLLTPADQPKASKALAEAVSAVGQETGPDAPQKIQAIVDKFVAYLNSLLGNAPGYAQGGGDEAGFASYAQGGVIPGPTGKPQIIIAHGGEEVIPVAERRSFSERVERQINTRDKELHDLRSREQSVTESHSSRERQETITRELQQLHALRESVDITRIALHTNTARERTEHVTQLLPVVIHTPTFLTGGIIADTEGQPHQIVAHGGEVVIAPEQRRLVETYESHVERSHTHDIERTHIEHDAGRVVARGGVGGGEGILASFQQGGVIPGTVGQPQEIIAHGGEAVITPVQKHLLETHTTIHNITNNIEKSSNAVSSIEKTSKESTASTERDREREVRRESTSHTDRAELQSTTERFSDTSRVSDRSLEQRATESRYRASERLSLNYRSSDHEQTHVSSVEREHELVRNLSNQEKEHISTQREVLRYQEGGTVPGPVDTPRLAVVHGGEKVLSVEQLRDIERERRIEEMARHQETVRITQRDAEQQRIRRADEDTRRRTTVHNDISKSSDITNTRNILLLSIEERRSIQQQEDVLRFQEGGIIPGTPGKPRLVIVHAGEEVVSIRAREEMLRSTGEAHYKRVAYENPEQHLIKAFNTFISHVQSFQYGGTVQGIPGQAIPIIAHAGEKILTREQQREREVETGAPVQQVIFNISHVHVNKPADLSRIADKVNRQLGREAGVSLRSRRLLGR